ncbi:hypothetical protein Q5P01_025675 [Channa striata]|uniref:Neuroblast differentiation-associated protein AHNAK n=1 Tax=Channa striata TaxID=64152 RepID=A0AA88LID6_CHASR|nr:hypothetical protein Q5P01_025675 [Channa striata]
MLSHRRGRSLSEALTLEQLEEGGLVISSINNSSSVNQELREGDEVLGATINFDKLSKDEVLNVLKLMEPYDDKVQVLTRNNLSKSLENLDVKSAKTPETMLKDSYSKLYTAKIKRFMRGGLVGNDGGDLNSMGPALPYVQGSSKGSQKHDTELPRRGVDFGILKTRTQNTKINADSESDDSWFSATADGSNLNLPPLGLGRGGTSVGGAQAPELDGPSGKLSLKYSKKLKNPDLNLDDPSNLAESPKYRLSGQSPDFDLELPGANVSKPDLRGLDINMPSGKMNVPLKKPKIDLKSPDLEGKTPDISVKTPKSGGSKSPTGKYQAPKFTMPSFELPEIQVPGFNGDLEEPNFGLTGPQVKVLDGTSPKVPDLDVNTDLNSPNLKAPKIKGGVNMPDVNIGSPSAKMKMPKFKQPKVNIPNIKGADFEGNLDGPDIDISSPNVKLKGAKPGFEMPNGDFSSSKFKKPHLKIPDVGFSGPKLDGPNLKSPDFNGKLPKGPNLNMNSDLKASDLILKAPKMKGGITASERDFNVPDAKLQMPNVEMPKGPNVDLDGDLQGTDLNIPNWDINGPDGKLKMPGLKAQDFSLSRPKAKKPDMNLSGGKMKSPGMPDLDIDDPSLKFKGPSYKNRRSDMTGVNVKAPELNADGDVRLRYPDTKSARAKGRSSFPVVGADLGDIDFTHPDLNIDDFTGKDHVLRARGSTDLQLLKNLEQVTSPSGVIKNPRRSRTGNVDVSPQHQGTVQSAANARLPHFSQESGIRVPDSSDEYLVTVFPTQAQNRKMPNRKYNTLGGLEFNSGNMDLEVPDEKDLKGSTFFFSNLV